MSNDILEVNEQRLMDRKAEYMKLAEQVHRNPALEEACKEAFDHYRRQAIEVEFLRSGLSFDEWSAKHEAEYYEQKVAEYADYHQRRNQ